MLADLKQTLERLPPRDRLALFIMVAVISAALVWLAGWTLNKAANKAQQQAMQERDTLTWLQASAPQLAGGSLSNGGLSVVDMVSSAAAGQGVTMQRFEPDGTRVRVWLESADFAKVAAWLDTLERQGVKSEEVHFEQTDKGLNVRLVFGR
ncbi:MAG: type II secretion system protein GspM [Fluviicoccus sp.]|uniref:type II secretion system protein GspM n=1 Tax=Fluviicoccus sp. TaxID=2003552 RepID=UPI002715BE0E|nr:type II secretion system protein GspM [Fluviicoccus sp.]MDO8328911.1 type II secretion system protein GspM [Fluviicoccus sp.]